MRERLFVWLDSAPPRLKVFVASLVATLVVAVVYLVHATGGIRFVYAHAMYLPIALAAVVFGVRGGVLVAIVGGVLLGPFTPIDTTTGEAQSSTNWLFRVGFFSLVAVLVGGASDAALAYLHRVRWHATHDDGTGLPNALALTSRVERTVTDGPGDRDPRLFLVALIGNLNEIESAFGSACMRDVVRNVAEAIRAELPEGEEVYRLGDDRLLAVTTATASAAEPSDVAARRFARTVRAASAGPHQVGELSVHTDVYLGIAATDGARVDKELWIRRASHAAATSRDRSLREAVIAGPEDESRAADNLRLLGELRHALVCEQISMHYQPKVDLRSGRVLGVEALMRWDHPSRGNVPPGAFIPHAENSTLIDEVTHHALDRSLQRVAAWDDAGLPQVRVAVNISTRNLANPRFADLVVDLLERHGVPGERLELEITESSFVEDMESSIAELNRLTSAKILLSVDDFGTGYSSLRYLESMPVSTLKIDQVFVRSLPYDDGQRKIVDAAIGLAHSLDIQVVAEGVETRDAYDYLCDAGCDLAQGYFVGRPLPAAETERLLGTPGAVLVPLRA